MKVLMYFLILLVPLTSLAQWANSIGGFSEDRVYGLAVDGSGNVYVTGYFDGTVDFDPGAGETEHVSFGSRDIFFAKYGSDGSLTWANRIGGSSDERGYSLAVDGSGNVYVTGSFSGTADFDPGTGTTNLTSAEGDDIFIAKYGSDGSLTWANSIAGPGAGTSAFERGYSLVVDNSGNVYITGYFLGTADFDPGAGITNLTSSGSEDIFFAKYGSDGSLTWANNIGGFSEDRGNSLAVDGSGNVYITGYFNNTANFDPGAGTTNLNSQGSRDIFCAKYGSDGSLTWANSFGGSGADEGLGISVDDSGNVYITGSFQGTADFGPWGTTANITSAGGYDIFIAKYGSDGSFTWANNIGGSFDDRGYGLAVDGSGNVYITGYFQGTADFDPGAVTTTHLTSAGSEDIFFAKYGSNGSLTWANSIGGFSEDRGYGLAVDGSGNVYVTGYFYGTADFDPGAGTTNHTSFGNKDIFITKYSSAGSLPVELTSFSALVRDNSVELNWETATEINNYGFEIERCEKQDLRSEKWSKIGFVNGHGNSNCPKVYTFTDNILPSGNLKYRLKQIDFDGAFEYSPTVNVFMNIPTNYSLEQNYPNPFNPETRIRYSIPFESRVNIAVYNTLGQQLELLEKKVQNAGTYELSFDTSSAEGGLSSGMYIYRMDAESTDGTDSFSKINKMLLVK